MKSGMTTFLERIGVTVLKRQNGELVADCPDCEKARHYYISDDTGLGYCHACGYRSNLFQLAQKVRPSDSNAETMTLLAEFGLAEVRQGTEPKRKPSRPRVGDTRPLTHDEEAQVCESKQISTEALHALQPVYTEQHGQPLALLPAYNPSQPDRPCGWLRVRLDGRPVQLGHGREEKYPIVRNSRHGLLGLSCVMSQKDGPLLFCEAWRDACAAIAQGYSAVASSGGASTWRDEWLPAFERRTVYLIFDRDTAGERATHRAAKAIATVAEKTLIITLPYDLKESHGKDLHDYVSEGNTVPELLSKAVEYEKEEAESTALSDDKPIALARKFVHSGPDIWAYHDNYGWLVCRANKYQIISDPQVSRIVGTFLDKCVIHKKSSDKWQDVELRVTRHTVTEVIVAAQRLVAIDADITPPAWLRDAQSRPDAKNIIAMDDCLLDISADKPRVLELTSDFFTVNYLPYGYDPQADCPQWRQFAEQLFCEIHTIQVDGGCYKQDYPDHDSTSLLQEWMGHLIIQDTGYQKILGVVGPPRSGKGTVGRVIRALVGEHNCTPTTLNSLCTDFGLQSMLKASVVLVSDASLSGRNIDTTRAVERLKSISGEDVQLVNRKHKDPVAAVLPVRFVIMANETQALHDPSGALASRLLYLVTTQSHLGKEDLSLGDRLLTELPGVFNWSLEGLKRLRERGYFRESETGRETRQEFLELSSPVTSFVQDCCELDVEAMEKISNLYSAYASWCDRNGRQAASKQKFSADLAGAFSELKRKQIRHGNDVARVFYGLRLRIKPSDARTDVYRHCTD